MSCQFWCPPPKRYGKCAITLPAWMIAATAAGAPAGAIARPSAPTVPAPGGGGATWPVGWFGRLAGGRRRRRRGGVCVVRSDTAPAIAARASDLLERAHLALREDAVDAESGRALEQAHARARRRAELRRRSPRGSRAS